MKFNFKMVGVGLLSGLLYMASASAKEETGQALYEGACVTCHTSKFGEASKIHTRTDRKVTSKDMLTAQVGRCAGNFAKDWTPEQLAKVEEYLNTSYYHFDAKAK